MTIERCPEPVNFKELFKTIPGEVFPKKRAYKGKTVFLGDKFSVNNKETLIFSIEKTNSRYTQGFFIKVLDGYLKIDGEPTPRRKDSNILLWEDSTVLDVKNIEVQVLTKKDHIFIGNIWETIIYEEDRFDITGKPKVVRFPEGKPVACFVNGDQWAMGRGNGAAMYSEDIPNGKRYFCNDGVEDDDFDDIIFTVTRIS